MKMTPNAVGIMIDLDALLDTRAGTIKQHYPAIYERIKSSPKYHLRQSDEWDLIDPKLTRSIMTLKYQGRDLETIKNSQITMVIRVILDLISDLKMKIKNNDPNVASFFFILNVHPYKLPEDVIYNIAIRFLTQIGQGGIPIAVYENGWSGLTPELLKEQNIRYWYCYHYEHWLQYQFEPIVQEKGDKELVVGCPEMVIYAPSLVQNSEGLEDLGNEMIDPVSTDYFQMTHAVFRNLANFKFLPVTTFCTIDADKLIQMEKSMKVSKSDVFGAPQEAVKDIMTRLGENQSANWKNINKQIEIIEELSYNLSFNGERNDINRLRAAMVQMQTNLLKLYNICKIDSGEDLGEWFEQLSLETINSEEEYLEVEKFWNDHGVQTIKREVALDNGEVIFRVIAGNDVNHTELGKFNKGDILPKRRAPYPKFKSILESDFNAFKGD